MGKLIKLFYMSFTNDNGKDEDYYTIIDAEQIAGVTPNPDQGETHIWLKGTQNYIVVDEDFYSVVKKWKEAIGEDND